MADKMLIRTKNAKRIAKIAVILRVVLFLGIPSVYLLFLSDSLKTDAEIPTTLTGIVGEMPVCADTYILRHLMGSPIEGKKNCTSPAILEFPPDGFTRLQRKHGFIALHCLLAIYCFLLLGLVCEKYFVPAIKIICEKLDMADDIAGATFMAVASSSPELFINCVGTFVTEGDLGVGAVVGSAVFNILAVPACCGLITGKVIYLDWWSVSRDCMMYAISVVALILTLLDDKVYWYEALILVCTYTIYILAMVFNGKLGKFVKSKCWGFNRKKMYTEVTPLLTKEKTNGLEVPLCYSKLAIDSKMDVELNVDTQQYYNDIESSTSSVWSWPGEKMSLPKKLFWVLTWPISFLLWSTVPNCQKYNRWYPLTFFMCICWIGGISYLVAWIITIIGDTLDIPDSITGLTFLAAGTSLPEAVSSVVVTNQGHGSMGISNSIGSNTFDILLCLGLPWLIKAVFYPATPGNRWVEINSRGLSYSAISLLTTLIVLYGGLALNKFNLNWKMGVVCAVVYFGYLALATLIELNTFSIVNIPTCPH